MDDLITHRVRTHTSSPERPQRPGLGARLFVKDLGEAPRAVDWDAPKHAASRGEVDLSWPLRPERPPG
jgi:hypothetical protein